MCSQRQGLDPALGAGWAVTLANRDYRCLGQAKLPASTGAKRHDHSSVDFNEMTPPQENRRKITSRHGERRYAFLLRSMSGIE